MDALLLYSAAPCLPLVREIWFLPCVCIAEESYQSDSQSSITIELVECVEWIKL